MGVLGIKVSILTDVVSNLFYPYDLDQVAKGKFKKSIEEIFKKYTFKEEINEEDFCRLLVYYSTIFSLTKISRTRLKKM